MRSGNVCVVFYGVALLLVVLPSGQCLIDLLIDSFSKKAADVTQAGLETVKTGTKGLDDAASFATDKITDSYESAWDTMLYGQKKTGELLESGAGSYVVFNRRLFGGVRDAAHAALRADGPRPISYAARTGIDFLKSTIDLTNKVKRGTLSALQTGLQETSGRALDSMPDIPVIKPLLTLPHNLIDISLKGLSSWSENSARATKGILDQFRPDEK